MTHIHLITKKINVGNITFSTLPKSEVSGDSRLGTHVPVEENKTLLIYFKITSVSIRSNPSLGQSLVPSPKI